MLKYVAAALLVGAPTVASAQAVISNGTVGLGVDRAGQLNVSSTNRSAGGTTAYGLRDVGTNQEATAQGCLCEGWGAAVAGTSRTVYANNAAGSSFTPVSFTSTATTATSVVSGGGLTVTHDFSPSVSALLYQVNVTIANTSGADFTGATLYRRVMDWDIEPTQFNEYSTIQGAVGAKNVVYTSDNGFASSNALSLGDRQSIVSGATGNFVDSGPADHGALFDFSFDPLAAGASRSFSIFYGAAPSETAALGALGSVGAEVYSFGQSSDDRLGGGTNRRTFIFGFKGVGGTAVADPGAVPEPATWAMMIVGFGAVGGTMRRRQAKVRFAAA